LYIYSYPAATSTTIARASSVLAETDPSGASAASHSDVCVPFDRSWG
jgi:hypothetical protein